MCLFKIRISLLMVVYYLTAYVFKFVELINRAPIQVLANKDSLLYKIVLKIEYSVFLKDEIFRNRLYVCIGLQIFYCLLYTFK